MLNGSNEMTVSIWIKPRTPSRSVELVTASRNAIGLMADGRFWVTTEEDGRADVMPKLSLSAGQWHHLAGRYDGRSLTVFRDGNLIARETHSGKIAGGSETYMVYRFGGLRGTNRFFSGSIVDLRIYNRTLSDTEITVSAKRTTSNDDPHPPVADPDRIAAEWVISVGGLVRTDNGTFQRGDALPAEPFQLRFIDIKLKKLSDSDIEKLVGLKHLGVLRLVQSRLTGACGQYIESLIVDGSHGDRRGRRPVSLARQQVAPRNEFDTSRLQYHERRPGTYWHYDAVNESGDGVE